jgi:hypothetical protein
MNQGAWHAILKGNAEVSECQSLRDQESLNSDHASTPVRQKSQKGRTLSRKPTTSSLSQPIAALPHLLENQGDVLVLDGESIKMSTSPIKSVRKLTSGKLVDSGERSNKEIKLHLNLDDPKEVPQASEFLLSSTNMHDQADILHYLYVSQGIDYYVKGMSTVGALLEELYQKAMLAKEWSVVRQTAGLLKKLVNSLTSNVTDLLTRQKPTTIGLRPNEFFLDSPKNPQELATIIFEAW